MCKIVTVLEALYIPMPEDCAEVTVLEKQARLVLFDGERYRSNIQTIRSPGAAKKDAVSSGDVLYRARSKSGPSTTAGALTDPAAAH